MSVARERRQDWWTDEYDDDAPTQAVPARATRGAAPRRSARQMAATVPLHAVAHDVPRVTRATRPVGRGAAEYEGPAAERGLPVPALPPLPDLSKVVTSVLLVGGLALLLYLGLTSLIGWGREKIDDVHYGRPRTTQLDAWVGHNEAGGSPSHFVALNLNRQVTIIEFPGGDVSKPQVIAGPYLFGRSEDLTVVKLRVEDANGDDKPDLTVQVKDERLIYINDGTAFRPITSEELAQVRQKEGAR
jgi:hypothetical protein